MSAVAKRHGYGKREEPQHPLGTCVCRPGILLRQGDEDRMGLERRAESRRVHEESIGKIWDKPIPSLRETQMFRGPLTGMEKLRKAPSMGQITGSV